MSLKKEKEDRKQVDRRPSFKKSISPVQQNRVTKSLRKTTPTKREPSSKNSVKPVFRIGSKPRPQKSQDISWLEAAIEFAI